MIKAVAHSEEGETLVILGVSEGNVTKLKDGRPLLIHMEELGFKGKLVIMYGTTEDVIAEELLKNLNLDPGAVVDTRDPEGMI